MVRHQRTGRGSRVEIDQAALPTPDHSKLAWQMVPPVPPVAHDDIEIVGATEVAPHVLAITDSGVESWRGVGRWHASMIAANSFSSSVSNRTSMYVESSSRTEERP